MKFKHAGRLVTAVMLATGTMLAQADVRYDLTAFESAVDDDPLHGTFSGSFSWLAPDFVSAYTVVNADALLSCVITASLGPASCTHVAFNPDPGHGLQPYLSFGAILPVFGYATIPYRFDVGTFSAPGTYIASGSGYPGTLTITAVPEPATVALMLAGLASVGALARRRKA